MARGRGDRADRATTQASGTPPVKVVVPPRVKAKQKLPAGATIRPPKPTRELEQFDLKAALPFFLARIGIFLVITVVLFLAVGLNPILSVLLGLIGGAAAGYPLARLQKRAARLGPEPVKPAPKPPVKPGK
jgi:hypothetical protein